MRIALFTVMFVFSLLAGRLVMLQGIDPNSYAMAAVKENTRPYLLAAPRGSIVDRYGAILATSQAALAITADPAQTAPRAAELAAILADRVPGLSHTQALGPLTRTGTRFSYVARKVKPQVWAQVQADMKAAKLGGLYTEQDPIREYPAGIVAPNVVGYVGADGKGLGGLEYQYDQQLAGRDGKAAYVVDTLGHRIPLATSTLSEPQPGRTAQLTLDADLQWYTQQRLARAVRAYGAQSGSVITLDIKTGEILVMASYPSFSSAEPGKSDKSDRGNRPVQEVYEPGSVEKVVTFAALTDAGLVNRNTRLVIPAKIRVADRVINDYWPHGTIRLTVAGVIAKSSNLGTILASRQLERARFIGYLRNFGYGQPTALGYPGESRGILRPAPWTELARDNVAFGQGISVTALQLAAAVNTIANGGVYLSPRLVKNWVSADGRATPAASPAPRRVVSRAAAAEVSLIMETVTGRGGSAPAAQIPGYRVAGKTGTAQRADPACGCYRGNTTSFIGFAPADRPRFLTYVVFQAPTDPHGGGIQAAPVFKDVMSYALQKYAVPPTGRPPPKLRLTW